MFAKIAANLAINKLGEKPSENGYYDFSIRSENYVIYSKMQFYMGIASLIIGLVGGILCMTANVGAGIILLVIFAMLGISMLMQFSNYRVEYDEEKIMVSNGFGKEKDYYIKDIVKVEHLGNAVLVTANTGKFSIDIQCIGVQRFMAFMQNKFEQ